MVLTFTDWNNYTDETGAARSIDWDNLEGSPRAAAAEAIRQALIERVAILTPDPAAYLAAREAGYNDGTYSGVDPFPGLSLLAQPIPIGVDMDGLRRLQAMEFLLHDIAKPAADRHRNGFVSEVGADRFEFLWVDDELPPIADDPMSAQWASDMRVGIDMCHAVKLWLADTDGDVQGYDRATLFLNGGRMDSRFGTDDIKYGEASVYRAAMSSHYTTPWADVKAAFATAPWTARAWSTSSLPYHTNGARMSVWWPADSDYLTIYRDKVEFAIIDTGRNCALSVYATYGEYQNAPFPEGSPTGMVLDGTTAPSRTPVHSMRDSRELPASPPSYGTETYAWALTRNQDTQYLLNFAVPGGFTFQETP